MSVSIISSHNSTKSYPAHVAIIMDGNGRWAKKRGLSRSEGHAEGVKALRNLIDHVKNSNIKILTLYAFSTENWQRTPSEVKFLMGLIKKYIFYNIKKFDQENIKIRIIGSYDGIDAEIIERIQEIEDKTKNNDGVIVQIAFNYSSWQEVTQMAKNLVTKAEAKQLTADEIDVDVIRRHLMTADSIDPDLVIRTGGEYRLSNFLLLQSAYAELVFQPVLWPDYQPDDFEAAIVEYMQRERRFGSVESDAHIADVGFEIEAVE